MTFQELINHFGSQSAAAQAVGTSRQVVSAWKRNGIPLGRQYEIQFLTGGKLRASAAHGVSLRGQNKPQRAGKNKLDSVKTISEFPIDNGAGA